jgi:hypothetical protein
MNNVLNITHFLISPKVSLLVDDDMAMRMLDQMEQLSEIPGKELTLSHGIATTWGIELAQEGQPDRTYRVAFILENHSPQNGEKYLSLVAIEEGTQLEIDPEKRMKLEEWKVIPIS